MEELPHSDMLSPDRRSFLNPAWRAVKLQQLFFRIPTCYFHTVTAYGFIRWR